MHIGRKKTAKQAPIIMMIYYYELLMGKKKLLDNIEHDVSF